MSHALFWAPKLRPRNATQLIFVTSLTTGPTRTHISQARLGPALRRCRSRALTHKHWPPARVHYSATGWFDGRRGYLSSVS